MKKDINLILAGEDIKDVLEYFIEQGLPDCRFMLILAVNENGRLGYYHAGNISGLEAGGLPSVVEDIASNIVDSLKENDTV